MNMTVIHRVSSVSGLIYKIECVILYQKSQEMCQLEVNMHETRTQPL